MGRANDDGPVGEPSAGTSVDLRELRERIHDGPLQDLAAAIQTLAVMRRSAFASIEEITEVGRLVDAATEKLRLIVDGGDEQLRPSGLATELRNLCAAFEADTGVRCQTKLHAEHLSLPPVAADIVFRSVRELLTNVRKHARATTVQVVSARRSPKEVTIVVADNGIGMAASKPGWQSAGTETFGLWSIQQRMAELGGFLEIEDDEGTRAVLVLPLGLSART